MPKDDFIPRNNDQLETSTPKFNTGSILFGGAAPRNDETFTQEFTDSLDSLFPRPVLKSKTTEPSPKGIYIYIYDRLVH